MSGKRVEFSGNVDRLYSAKRERLYGRAFLCLNPAYGARGSQGFNIPAICKLDPPLQAFAVHGVDWPRHGGYELVIWGTGPTSVTAVVARFRGGEAQGAVFPVRSQLARRFGERPFSLFVLELPLESVCGPVTVTAAKPRATDRLRPRTALVEQRLGLARVLATRCSRG